MGIFLILDFLIGSVADWILELLDQNQTAGEGIAQAAVIGQQVPAGEEKSYYQICASSCSRPLRPNGANAAIK